MKQGITTHTIVRNEDRFVWFALTAVARYVDRMLVFDTGSTDETKEIINSIKNPKLIFAEKGKREAEELVGLRQQQIDRTDTEWFLILDGDEIWWEAAIKKVVHMANRLPQNIWGIITPTINCVGDIYHYQEERAGRYEFGRKKGHYAVRAMRRNIRGLHVEGRYPLEGYFDSQGKPITKQDNKLVFLDKPYLHVTNLKRSTKQQDRVIARERKYEVGIPFPANFRYPEVFYEKYPSCVPSPWTKMTKPEKLRSLLETPLKKVKRRIL